MVAPANSNTKVGNMEQIVENREYTFVPVPADALSVWWGQVADLLTQSPETWEKYWNLEDIRWMLACGDMQLFIVLKGFDLEFAMITQIAVYPKMRMVKLLWCSGRNIRKFMPLSMTAIDDFAQGIGASEVKLFGRKEWQKVLKSFGYELDHIVLRKYVPGCAPVFA